MVKNVEQSYNYRLVGKHTVMKIKVRTIFIRLVFWLFFMHIFRLVLLPTAIDATAVVVAAAAAAATSDLSLCPT